jgi:hypothetical protein
MEPVILDQIPFALDRDLLRRRLRVRPGSAETRELDGLVDQALALGLPRALYGVAYIERRAEAEVMIDSVTFASRVLAVNVSPVHRVFPYLATCGAELGEWADSLGDILHQFWAEEIKLAALASAIEAMRAALERDFRPGDTSAMNPGSLSDWPLYQQRPMFALLRDAALVGVKLNDSCLMTPNKSVTGLRFSTESTYENCMLCPRADCPGRRAPYDATLWHRRYEPDSPPEVDPLGELH